jgi:hypothetical protein
MFVQHYDKLLSILTLNSSVAKLKTLKNQFIKIADRVANKMEGVGMDIGHASVNSDRIKNMRLTLSFAGYHECHSKDSRRVKTWLKRRESPSGPIDYKSYFFC